MKKEVKAARVNHIVMGQTLALLKAGPVTAQKVAQETGVHIVTAQDWLRELRQQRVVFVSGWLPDSLGRDAVPVYEFGNESDEPKRSLSRAEISKRYRQRRKEKEQS
jgi:predicted ArsR family transcriptional regulator